MATNEWGEFFDTLGGLVILAGIVFAIITFAYTYKLIGLLMKKQLKTGTNTGRGRFHEL